MKQFFRRTALVLALGMIFLLGGCSKQEPPAETVSPEPAPVKTLYQQGQEVAAEIVEMAGNRDYLALYTGDKEILNLLAAAVEGKDYTAPKEVYSIKVSDSAMEKILNLAEIGELEGLSDELLRKIHEKFFQALPTQVNAMGGTEVLAASSICTTGKVFVNPEVTEGAIYLYTYQNGTPVAVTFLPGEDGAVSATGTLLLNDDFQIQSLEDLKGLLGVLGVEVGVVQP